MAEDKNSAAQSKLGELFVDIGSSGLGTLVKGLNTLSTSFLVTKNAATQFTKPIINMSKTATQGVIGLDKISSVMGLTVDELQRLQVWTKLNNVSFGDFIGQLQNAQQKIMDVRTGMAEAPAGLSRLGLTAFDFDPHDPLGFLNTIMEKISTLDNVTAASALRWLGLSEDLIYTWQQGNQVFDERLLLDDRELENLRKQQSAWNTLGVSLQAAFSKWIANQDKATNKLINLTDNTSGLVDVVNEDLAPALGIVAETLITLTIWGAKFVKVMSSGLKWVGEKVGDFWGTLQYNLFGGGNIDSLNSKDWAELSKNPEKMQKYLAARNKLYETQAQIEKQYQDNRQKYSKPTKNKTSIKPRLQYNPTQENSHNASVGNNNFGVMGSQLLSPTPIDDFSAPAAVNSQLPALPPHLQNNNVNNNISFQINQTITGDNAEQIAAASAEAIDEASLNILQAQNQWSV
jgi:hypothetical protein